MSMSFATEPSLHPNKMLFDGILVILDSPSDKPPNGAEGHRIMVPSTVATKRLDTLIGMGVNYAPDLAGHKQTHKVGVIDKAWIDGKNLRVSGTIWKHDFPEAQKDLKQKKLGMSMEIGEVHVDDVSADVWELSDFYFIGATILFQDAAAYTKTHLIAAKADERSNNTMKKPVAKTAAKAATGGADIGKIAASQDKIIELMTKSNTMLADLATRVDNLEINAAGMADVQPEMETEADDDVTASEDVTAAFKKKGAPAAEADDEDDDEDEEMEDDDMESAAEHGIETGDLETLGPKLPEDADSDDTPGHFNKGSKNKGAKTTVEDKVGRTVESARIANLTQHVGRLQKELQASNEKVAQLSQKLQKTAKQVSAAAEQTGRKSYSPEVLGLLAKSNLDAREISASGAKMTGAEVDAVIAAAGVNLDPTKRMAIKNEFLKQGLMEDGIVKRGL